MHTTAERDHIPDDSKSDHPTRPTNLLACIAPNPFIRRLARILVPIFVFLFRLQHHGIRIYVLLFVIGVIPVLGIIFSGPVLEMPLVEWNMVFWYRDVECTVHEEGYMVWGAKIQLAGYVWFGDRLAYNYSRWGIGERWK